MSRPTFCFKLVSDMGGLRMVKKTIRVHFVSDGVVALMRAEDGQAYEVQIRPACYGSHFPRLTKRMGGHRV